MRAQEMQNICYKAEEWSLGAWYLLSVTRQRHLRRLPEPRSWRRREHEGEMRYKPRHPLTAMNNLT